ncbi:MAG: hypothetical protein ACXADW_15820 [Candidatus Hodarchaeales archaeon]|jgi:hypothetical protein
MVQVFIAKKANEKPIEVEKIIIIEEIPEKKEEYKRITIEADEKGFKRSLLKLIKKAKHNPKYLQETRSIDKIKRNLNYRNTGIY